ncbi:hypothetical protein [Variovorax sp. W2I14]|uniref:hypothetical protein n=1 Tax=Variovorax sp. W2I14 TaxID=3042290 RepID=UPI003D2143BE
MRLFIAGLDVVQLAGSLLHITVWGSVLFDIGGVLNGEACSWNSAHPDHDFTRLPCGSF